MADIAGSYNSNQSYNPKFVYNISYSQTGRSGSSVSYRFNVSFSKQNGWYGYDININWNIGGSTGAKQIKSTADVSSGSTSFDVTCSTNAAGGTLAASIYTSSSTDGTHWQNQMNTGSRTVNKSTFNTPPSMSGSVTAGGTTGNKTIPENTGTITVNWPKATDANNNVSGYRLRVSVNGGGYSELTRTNASTYTYNHNVSNYGEGTTFRYAVDAYDSYSEWSGTIYSGTLTKNRFAQSTIDSGSSIKYSDGNSTINFTIAGGSNTDGSAIKSRVLTCDGITVYNGNVGTGSINVTVFRTGTTPTGPYVKFDDIKNKFAGNSYTGTLTFKLTTSNNYNNSKHNSKNISVNLKTKPNAVSSCTIATTASTAYKQVASTKNYYYIPDSGRYIRVEWGAGSGKLGEAITYEVYVSYNGGSFQLVADKLSSATRAYNHNVPKQTVSQSIRYRIRTKTSYGEYTDKDTALATLHFYNAPGITQGTITRGATTADVVVTVKSNSSIPNINTVGSWKVYVKDTTTVAGNSGNLTVSQGAQTIKVTGLEDNGQYDLKVTFNDDTGFASNVTKTIVIGANSPIFFVNKYGVGVNGVKASASEAMKIKGTIGMTDAGGIFSGVGGIRMYQGDANGAGMAIQSGGTVVVGSGESAVNLIETISNKADETLHLASDGAIKFVTNCQTIANRVTATLDGSGTFNANNVQVGGQNVYHTGRKPNMYDLNIEAFGSGNDVNTYNPSKMWVGRTSNTSTNRPGDYYTVLNVGANYSSNFQLAHHYGNTSTFMVRGRHDTTGNYTPWAKVYTNKNKPTPDELGDKAQNANTLAQRDSNGDINVRLVKSNYANQTTMSGAIAFRVNNSNDNYVRFCSSATPVKSWLGLTGNIPTLATRITNLNQRLNSGWYAWSNNASGRPTDYGVLLVIQWGTDSDFCQIAFGTNNAMWTRWYVNGAWQSWSLK